jgi:RHS repeat-associated protein
MYDYPVQYAPLFYKFTGKERDTESGLDYFGARHNASSLGRFMQTDPKQFTARHLALPQKWNKYAYVQNNPLASVDPNGLDDYKVFIVGPGIGGNWSQAQAAAETNGHTFTIYRGADASIQNFNRALKGMKRNAGKGMRGQTGVAPFLLPKWEHDNFPVELLRRLRREFRNLRTGGTFPILSVYAAKIKPSCLASRTRFVGLPAFRGASARRVECSRLATNSSDPRGLPVCVYCRTVATSLADSPTARCSLHSATVQRFRQRSISRRASGGPPPQCAAALDHRHAAAVDTIPARTGFNST